MQRTEIIGKNPTQDFQTIILNLNMYATKALTSLDNLKSYVSPEEYKKIEIYVNDIRKAITQFCDIEEELVSYYKQLLDIAAVNGGTADNKEFSCYLKLVDECFKKVPTAYMGPYQDLLNMKREVFDGIYADIEDEQGRYSYSHGEKGCLLNKYNNEWCISSRIMNIVLGAAISF